MLLVLLESLHWVGFYEGDLENLNLNVNMFLSVEIQLKIQNMILEGKTSCAIGSPLGQQHRLH
jgi:hypothetical protein